MALAPAPAAFKLRLRGTFIDLENEVHEQEDLWKHRSLTEGCLPSMFVDEEVVYVERLSEKLAALNSVQGLSSFFGLDAVHKGAMDATSIATTRVPPATADGASDSDSTAASHSSPGSGAEMQHAMTSIQQVGQSLARASPAANFGELTAGAAAREGINASVADVLLQLKAVALKSPEAAGVADKPAACNPGSVGHPELCNRPCIHWGLGDCGNGADCDYCHFAHPKRPVHLDKRHREMLRAAPPNVWMAVMLPALVQKVEALAVDKAAAGATVASLAAAAGLEQPGGAGAAKASLCRGDGTVARMHRSLYGTLQSMTLKTLLSTMLRGFRQHGCDVGPLVDELLVGLRGEVEFSAEVH